MIFQWRITELIYAEQHKTKREELTLFIIFEVLLCEKMKTFSCFLDLNIKEASLKTNHLIKIKIVQQIDELIF